jgi:hypothetical protein
MLSSMSFIALVIVPDFICSVQQESLSGGRARCPAAQHRADGLQARPALRQVLPAGRHVVPAVRQRLLLRMLGAGTLTLNSLSRLESRIAAFTLCLREDDL